MKPHPASYRDPAGFVFSDGGTFYRAVMPAYAPHYEWATTSGFFAEALAAGQLLPFEALPDTRLHPPAWRILKPDRVSRWTYPCEWSFEQLRDTALLTLDLTALALQKGGILKDASAQNVQFVAGRPVFIDTLSVARREEGASWTAFRQFCAEFLYPLLLAHYQSSFRLSALAAFPRGFSALQVAQLLPRKARWNISNRLYVYLPAMLEQQPEKGPAQNDRKISTVALARNISHLQRRIAALQPAYTRTAWSDYYEETILSPEYLAAKEVLISAWLSEVRPASVLDLGCNTGVFSLLAARNPACEVTATDADAACIDRLYRNAAGLKNLRCLVTDLTHPLTGGGWAGAEWQPWLMRMSGHEAVWALALVHHLALVFNISLAQIAALLAVLATRQVVVEWVPKSDPKAQGLLRHREDVFDHYTEEAFMAAMQPFFRLQRKEPVAGSERVLYFWEKKAEAPGRIS